MAKPKRSPLSLLQYRGAKRKPTHMEQFASRLGSRLESLREEKGLTIEEVAERMNAILDPEAGAGRGGISASTVGQIERGEIDTPSAPVLSAFAQVLDTTVEALEEFLTEGEEPGSGRF